MEKLAQLYGIIYLIVIICVIYTVFSGLGWVMDLFNICIGDCK